MLVNPSWCWASCAQYAGCFLVLAWYKAVHVLFWLPTAQQCFSSPGIKSVNSSVMLGGQQREGLEVPEPGFDSLTGDQDQPRHKKRKAACQ